MAGIGTVPGPISAAYPDVLRADLGDAARTRLPHHHGQLGIEHGQDFLDARLAKREITQALGIHRELEDKVGEVADQRIHAKITACDGGDAESMFRECMRTAEKLGRPLIQAESGRDLATFLSEKGRGGEAADAARTARVLFHKLGAIAEVRKLDQMIEQVLVR